MAKNNPNAGNTIIVPSVPTFGHDLDSRSDAEIFGYVTREQLQKPLTEDIVRYERFPEVMIALNEEMLHHPSVCIWMAQCIDSEPYNRMAHLAAHLGIIVDGMYSLEDMKGLAEIMLSKLRELRATTVIL